MGDAMDATPTPAPEARPGPSQPPLSPPSSSSSSMPPPPDDEDALLYDPDADDSDAAWAAGLRGGRGSDALLSCAACLTTVCLECEAHATAPGRFRALATLNCRLAPGLAVPASRLAGGKRKAVGEDGGDGAGLTCVVCDVCGEVVGAADGNGVTHFFSVVPSET